MDISEFKKTGNLYKRHPWEISRAKIIQHLLNKNGKRFRHLLDMGSGDAYVLNTLCADNISEKYTAVDTAYEPGIIDEIASQNLCSISFLKNLPEQLNPAADGILLLDVIEHCENDSAILRQVSNPAIAQYFILLITVPAFQSLFSQHDELLFHHRRYSIKQLKHLCKNNGFTIEQAGYFFFSLLIIRWVHLFLEKLGLRKSLQTIDRWKGNKLLTSLYCSLLMFDFRLGQLFSKTGIHLPGLSAYCICRPLQS